MIVMKFGGTSVQNEEAIGRVISIVGSRLKERPLVVVSALARVTRLLLEIAEEAEGQHGDAVKELLGQLRKRHEDLSRNLLSKSPDLLAECLCKVEDLISSLESFTEGVCQIGELSPRSKARIISTGELLSSTIISYAFNAEGISSRWIDARRMVITDDNYMNARPDLEVTEANVKRIVGREAKGVDVVITQGFVATTATGSPAVLGFEGSDYSAAIFGMALGAERVEIWTDVDGMRSADPRVVSDTTRIETASYEEAAEMAAMGARVLHPLTIEPARMKNIPIQVLNSGNPECPGTLIVKEEDAPDGPKSVAFRSDILFVTIESSKIEGVTKMLGNTYSVLNSLHVPVILCAASESRVSITIPDNPDIDDDNLEEALETLSRWAKVTVYRDKAQISFIGRNIISSRGLGDRTVSSAGKIYMSVIGNNLMSESFVIDRNKLQDTLVSMHDFIFINVW